MLGVFFFKVRNRKRMFDIRVFINFILVVCISLLGKDKEIRGIRISRKEEIVLLLFI